MSLSDRRLERAEETVAEAVAAGVRDAADETETGTSLAAEVAAAAPAAGNDDEEETLSSSSSQQQQPKQKFPDGTLISMWLGHDDWNEGQRYDGVIIGYDCFNFPSTTDEGLKEKLRRTEYGRDYFHEYINDQHYKRIKEEWRYMVRFPASDNTRHPNGSSATRQRSKFNNKSFIEFVSEDEIKKSLSENCVGYVVCKHFGTLRQDVLQHYGDQRDAHYHYRHRDQPGPNYLEIASTTANTIEVDWDAFLGDLKKLPEIATYDLALKDKNKDDDDDDDDDDEYYISFNVLSLTVITSGWSTKKINVIKKLLELNPDAINYQHSPEYGFGGFYHNLMDISPEVFKEIDPKILRLFLQHTEDKEQVFVFAERNGLGPIILFLRHQQEQEQEQEQDQQDLSSSDDDNEEDDKKVVVKSVTIPPQVKVILEESCEAVTILLAEVFMNGGISNQSSRIADADNNANEDDINNVDGDGDGGCGDDGNDDSGDNDVDDDNDDDDDRVLEISEEVLKFALDCASNNKYKCFYRIDVHGVIVGGSNNIDINIDDRWTKNLLELMFDCLRNDNRYLFDRYMKLLVCDDETVEYSKTVSVSVSGNSNYSSSISLVNCVLQILGNVLFDVMPDEHKGDVCDGDDGNDKGSTPTTLKQSDIETICRLDTIDHQFWQPLTLSDKKEKVPITEDQYVHFVMPTQAFDKVVLKSHYKGMKEFSKRFIQEQNNGGGGGGDIAAIIDEVDEVDLGKIASCWWEYGQLKQKYWKNHRRWNRFWEIFGHDEWEIDGNDDGDGTNDDKNSYVSNHRHQHPLFTAIRLGYQMNPVINDIINKDPKAVGTLYNQLPPFALVAATWSSYNINKETTLNNDALNTTYDLLRMNPAMISTGGADTYHDKESSSIDEGGKLSVVEDKPITDDGAILRPLFKKAKLNKK